jgi:staphylococcal nuclease domain-containing protein 1
MQRDVEIEIETVDKSGGFIGTLWLNKNENAAVILVQEGLATVHSYSADTLSWAKQLYAAEVRLMSHPRGTPCPGVPSEFGSPLTPLASSF